MAYLRRMSFLAVVCSRAGPGMGLECAADGGLDHDTLVAQLVERLRHFRGPRPPADDATLLAFQIAP